MRRVSAPPLVALGGLLMLVSLYLPWRSSSCGAHSQLSDEFNCFPQNFAVGWDYSPAAGFLAVLDCALLVAAAVLWVRPDLYRRLPIGGGAIAAAYFVIAGEVDSRDVWNLGDHAGLRLHYGYGSYVAWAGALVALLGGAASLRGTSRTPDWPSRTLAVLPIGILVALLLPWQTLASMDRRFSLVGIQGEVGAAAAAFSLALVIALWRGVPSKIILWLSASTVLLTAETFQTAGLYGSRHAYGGWLALAFAGVLGAVTLWAVVVSRWTSTLTLLSNLGRVAGALLFAASLFMPWSRFCPTAESGGCVSIHPWTLVGSVAVALVFLSVTTASSRGELPFVVAFALALFASSLGFEFTEAGAASPAYGLYVGAIAAAIVVVLTATRAAPPIRDSRRIVPGVVCLALLATIVVPWWEVLPWSWANANRGPTGFGTPEWIPSATLLLGVILLFRWIAHVSARPGAQLTLLPLVMLGLIIVDATAAWRRGDGWWNPRAEISAGLCLVMVALGWAQGQEDWKGFALPEILRIDRI